jgi:hypothetical protein
MTQETLFSDTWDQMNSLKFKEMTIGVCKFLQLFPVKRVAHFNRSKW